MRGEAIKLFKKSVLKQRKYKEIVDALGSTEGLRCLDVGGDNGVISLLLRERGGHWSSADLDGESIESIRALVGTDVFRFTDGEPTPFPDGEFDRVVIIDYLEHIIHDTHFIDELARILKNNGQLIINVPHHRETLLRRLRLVIGQTDEEHGHVRPGYTLERIRELLDRHFIIEEHRTYSRFFSELIDTAIRFGVSKLKKAGKGAPKGQIVTGQDLQANKKMFRMYSVMYPFVWTFSRFDTLIPFTSGYMLIVRARKTAP